MTSTNASVRGHRGDERCRHLGGGQCGAAPYASAAARVREREHTRVEHDPTAAPGTEVRDVERGSRRRRAAARADDPSRSNTTIAAMQIIRLALTATPLGSTTRRCSLKIMSAPNSTSGNAAGAGRSSPQITATATATPSTAAVSQRNCEGKVDTPVLLGWERVLWRYAAGSGPGGFLIRSVTRPMRAAGKQHCHETRSHNRETDCGLLHLNLPCFGVPPFRCSGGLLSLRSRW